MVENKFAYCELIYSNKACPLQQLSISWLHKDQQADMKWTNFD